MKQFSACHSLVMRYFLTEEFYLNHFSLCHKPGKVSTSGFQDLRIQCGPVLLILASSRSKDHITLGVLDVPFFILRVSEVILSRQSSMVEKKDEKYWCRLHSLKHIFEFRSVSEIAPVKADDEIRVNLRCMR